MRFFMLTLVAASLAACRSGSMGRLPDAVVDAYDEGTPAGWMEIEAERDGRVVEVEADIDPADVPANIMAAAKEQLPGGRVTGAEFEVVGGTRSYEVKMTRGNRDYEFVYDRAGMLLESEKELMRNEAPSGVVENALASFPGSSFKSVEIITRKGEADVYHVKVTRNGASYKVVLDGNGMILRRVREAKAEIEIPLR